MEMSASSFAILLQNYLYIECISLLTNFNKIWSHMLLSLAPYTHTSFRKCKNNQNVRDEDFPCIPQLLPILEVLSETWSSWHSCCCTFTSFVVHTDRTPLWNPAFLCIFWHSDKKNSKLFYYFESSLMTFVFAFVSG